MPTFAARFAATALHIVTELPSLSCFKLRRTSELDAAGGFSLGVPRKLPQTL
jgi:hypothetical protein